ncbi:AAA family ATPase [Mycolicibacter arupensis]|uniref:AAA family ATPase n=1 Tax=Mycolicibacter arupensis TaxID=342002 RepID=UPI003B3BA501
MSTTVPRPEMRAVADLLARARPGPAALMVEGEAGIGKTTLVLHALEVARNQGFSVLSAHGSVAEVEYAYAAVADLIGGIDQAVLAKLTSQQRRALDRAQDALTAGAPDIDERTIAAAFCAAIENLSATSPVLLALDDAQWLDPSSRAVIGFTARRLSGAVGLLVTVRLGEPHGADAARWLTLRDPSAIARLRVGPWDLEGTHNLIAHRWGRGLARPALLRVHRLSGGNPMFALELARAQLDSPDAANEFPSSLAALVSGRLERLTGDSEAVRLAAACSASPTAEELAAVTRLSAVRVIAAVEVCEKLGMIALGGHHIRFTHPLYASGVAANAAPARRRAVHRSLAAVVTDPGLRARHLVLSATTVGAADLAEIDAAAETLAASGAKAAAAELIDAVLDRGGDSPQRRIRCAELHFRSGSILPARRHLQAVLDGRPSASLRALALAHLGAVQAYDDDLPGAIEALSGAAADAVDVPMLRLVCLLRLALALAIADQMSATIEHAQGAISLAEELDAPGLLSQALAIWVTATFIWGHGVDGGALRLAVQLEDPHSGATTFLRARAAEAVISAYVGDLETANAQIRAVRDGMTADGSEVDLVWVDNRIAAVAIWAGRYDEAGRAAHAAVLRAEQFGGRLSCATAWTKRAAVAAFQGRTAEARADAHAAIEAAVVAGAARQVKEPTRVLAFVEVSLGDYASALTVLRPLLDQFDPPHELEIEGGEHLPDAIEALVAVERIDEAETLVHALETHGAARDRPWMMAVGARGRAMVLAARGDLAGAQRALGRALTQHQRLRMPFEQARTELLLGQLHRRRRQRASATAALGAALKAFQELGTPIWADRAQSELVRLGSASRRLTRAEGRMAVLASQGLTNREIAGELFLAEKTVESTLSSVYRKLGIRSRVMLSAALSGEGVGADDR